MNLHYRSIRGIHVLFCWSEQKVYAPLLGECRVVIQSAWITREVLRGTELQWIDEDAHYDDLTNAARLVHQLEMPLVQRAHRRHKRDALALGSGVGNNAPHLGDRLYELH